MTFSRLRFFPFMLMLLAVPAFAAQKGSDKPVGCGCAVKQMTPDAAAGDMVKQQINNTYHRLHATPMDIGEIQNRDPDTGSTLCTSIFMTCWYTYTYIGDNYVEVLVDCTC